MRTFRAAMHRYTEIKYVVIWHHSSVTGAEFSRVEALGVRTGRDSVKVYWRWWDGPSEVAGARAEEVSTEVRIEANTVL